MDGIEERIAYLQGLVRGMGARQAEPVGPVVEGILDVLADVADSLADVLSQQAELARQVARRGADLVWTFTCPTCGAEIEVEDDVFDEEGHVELVCPECGTLVHDGEPEDEPPPAEGRERPSQGDGRPV
ncbi:MAG: hypothetical protein IRZ11_02400 [Clostridia bacterium]|nr:hypothetical protein [Clostridia bacterium]